MSLFSKYRPKICQAKMKMAFWATFIHGQRFFNLRPIKVLYHDISWRTTWPHSKVLFLFFKRTWILPLWFLHSAFFHIFCVFFVWGVRQRWTKTPQWRLQALDHKMDDLSEGEVAEAFGGPIFGAWRSNVEGRPVDLVWPTYSNLSPPVGHSKWWWKVRDFPPKCPKDSGLGVVFLPICRGFEQFFLKTCVFSFKYINFSDTWKESDIKK